MIATTSLQENNKEDAAPAEPQIHKGGLQNVECGDFYSKKTTTLRNDNVDFCG